MWPSGSQRIQVTQARCGHSQAAEGTQHFLSMLGSPSEDTQTLKMDADKNRETWASRRLDSPSPHSMTSGLCSALQSPQIN